MRIPISVGLDYPVKLLPVHCLLIFRNIFIELSIKIKLMHWSLQILVPAGSWRDSCWESCWSKARSCHWKDIPSQIFSSWVWQNCCQAYPALRWYWRKSMLWLLTQIIKNKKKKKIFCCVEWHGPLRNTWETRVSLFLAWFLVVTWWRPNLNWLRTSDDDIFSLNHKGKITTWDLPWECGSCSCNIWRRPNQGMWSIITFT